MKTIKCGDYLMILIPKDVERKLEISRGEPLEYKIVNNTLVINRFDSEIKEEERTLKLFEDWKQAEMKKLDIEFKNKLIELRSISPIDIWGKKYEIC